MIIEYLGPQGKCAPNLNSTLSIVLLEVTPTDPSTHEISHIQACIHALYTRHSRQRIRPWWTRISPSHRGLKELRSKQLRSIPSSERRMVPLQWPKPQGPHPISGISHKSMKPLQTLYATSRKLSNLLYTVYNSYNPLQTVLKSK